MTVAEQLARGRLASSPPLRSPGAARLHSFQRAAARRLLSALHSFGGAILADDVGTGKTFTACAVIGEARLGGSRIEVCAPAPLLIPWRQTLARFGILDAILFSHDSIPLAGRPDGSRLLVVDEAHRFRNRRARRRERLARRSLGAMLLLVTATPLWNRLDDLLALIELLVADDRCAGLGVPSIEEAFATRSQPAVRSVLSALLVRREHESLSAPFPGVRRHVVRFDPAGPPTLGAIDALRFPLLRDDHAALLRRFLRLRLESGPEALQESLARQRRYYRRALDALQRGCTLNRTDFARLLGGDAAGWFQDLLFPGAFLPRDAGAGDRREIECEIGRLDALVESVPSIRRSKAERLLEVVSQVELPAIVFCTARATAASLWRDLRERCRAALLTSSETRDPGGAQSRREAILTRFRERRIDVLVVTDLASEGLDVQAAASVIHYDLPWTAVRVDQRNGRSRRLGQVRAGIDAVFFVPSMPAREVPARYVRRKALLSRRWLRQSPMETLDESEGPFPPGVCLNGDGVVLAPDGSAWTADPERIVELLSEASPARPFVALDPWVRSLTLLPPRLPPSHVQSCLAARWAAEKKLDAESVRLLSRRYRAAVEGALGDLIDGEPRSLASLVDSDAQRGLWNTGAPVATSTVDAYAK